MEFKLPLEIETPEQLHAAEYEIERYASWMRTTNVQRQVGTLTPPPEPSLSTETLAIIQSLPGKEEVTIPILEALVLNLRQLKLPVLHLVLVDIVSPQVRRQLVEWVRANGHPQALVDLTADRTIGGGVIIRTPNHLYDHSFRTRLMADRNGLSQVLARVR